MGGLYFFVLPSFLELQTFRCCLQIIRLFNCCQVVYGFYSWRSQSISIGCSMVNQRSPTVAIGLFFRFAGLRKKLLAPCLPALGGQFYSIHRKSGEKCHKDAWVKVWLPQYLIRKCTHF